MLRLRDSSGGHPTAREGLATLLASAGVPREKPGNRSESLCLSRDTAAPTGWP